MRMKLFLLIVIAVPLLARQVPKVMIKVSVRLERSDLAPESFAAKPKVMYRAGSAYCRTEEMPDPEHGIHGLTIINEPDAWMVNLLTKTARHLVDSGPTFNCRMPIFHDGQMESGPDVKGLSELEFGREMEYFKEKGALSSEGPVLQGKPTRVYASGVGGSQILLFTTGAPERPWAVARKQGDDVTESFWYGAYEELPFDAKLFTRPEGVKIEEVK